MLSLTLTFLILYIIQSTISFDCLPTETLLFYEDGEDISEWIADNHPSYGSIVTNSGEMCLIKGCIAIWAYMPVDATLLSSYISTTDYKNIIIKYSVYPALSSGADTCRVSYTVDFQTSFTQISGTNFLDNDRFNNITATLGTDAADTDYLQIILENIQEPGYISALQYCNFDEIKVCGTNMYTTAAPTSDTVQPTVAPTKNPVTSNPTEQPTAPTTAEPTDDTANPTSPPSVAPTEHPTVSSNSPTEGTASPSVKETEYIFVTTEDVDVIVSIFVTEEYGSNVVDTTKENTQTSFEAITACIAGVLATGIVITGIDGKVLRPNDYFKIGTLLKSALQILDFVSDVFFMITIANHPDLVLRWYLLILCILSVIFILLPVCISIFQLQSIVEKHWNKNDEIKAWLQNHSYHLFMLSLFCGNSFSAISVCSSNAFGLRLFCMPLSKLDKAQFQYRRVYSVVLLENLPQFLIAVCYASIEGGTDAIVYISMAFSALSILMMLAAMQTLKQLINSQDHSILCINVIGGINAANIKFCQRKIKNIKRHMSILLGVDVNLIEIPKPQQIHQGLQLKVILLINNDASGNLNAEGKISDTDVNHGIAECVKENWDLPNLPQIAFAKYEQNRSKTRVTNVDEGKRLKTEDTHNVSMEKGVDSDINIDK